VELVPDDLIHIDGLTTNSDSGSEHLNGSCECKITVIEGSHCETCMLKHHESVVVHNDAMLQTIVPVRKPKSIRNVGAAVSPELPTTLGTPIFPTGESIDTPSEKIFVRPRLTINQPSHYLVYDNRRCICIIRSPLKFQYEEIQKQRF